MQFARVTIGGLHTALDDETTRLHCTFVDMRVWYAPHAADRVLDPHRGPSHSFPDVGYGLGRGRSRCIHWYSYRVQVRVCMQWM
jgi:hypothetical protein